jgi:hypothetical protein
MLLSSLLPSCHPKWTSWLSSARPQAICQRSKLMWVVDHCCEIEHTTIFYMCLSIVVWKEKFKLVLYISYIVRRYTKVYVFCCRRVHPSSYFLLQNSNLTTSQRQASWHSTTNQITVTDLKYRHNSNISYDWPLQRRGLHKIPRSQNNSRFGLANLQIQPILGFWLLLRNQLETSYNQHYCMSNK